MQSTCKLVITKNNIHNEAIIIIIIIIYLEGSGGDAMTAEEECENVVPSFLPCLIELVLAFGLGP
jgi:hypothetical protein